MLHDDVAYGGGVHQDTVGEPIRQPGCGAMIDPAVAVEAPLAHQGHRPARAAADERGEEVPFEQVAVDDVDVPTPNSRATVFTAASVRAHRTDAEAPHGGAESLEHGRDPRSGRTRSTSRARRSGDRGRTQI